MLRRSSHNKFWQTRFLATALAVWLSGMSCLLCCGKIVSAETPEAESCAAADECSTDGSEAHGERGCCLESHDQSDSSPCQKECCILDGPSSDLPRAPHLIQPSATPVQAAWNLVPADIPAQPDFQPGQLQLPNKQETYLQCRVFLI
ncbi:MAG: hypothetical protein AB7U82_01590 [Blastocatellales bacterium]